MDRNYVPNQLTTDRMTAYSELVKKLFLTDLQADLEANGATGFRVTHESVPHGRGGNDYFDFTGTKVYFTYKNLEFVIPFSHKGVTLRPELDNYTTTTASMSVPIMLGKIKKDIAGGYVS
jgi:hypothetical protein